MKKFTCLLMLCCLTSPAIGPALGATPETKDQLPAELTDLLQVPASPFPESATLPDYMLNRPTPLSGAEKESLNMANEWATKYAKPLLMGNGKLVWMYGVSRPTIVGAPMQVCDIELQSGEQINNVMLGDSARWVLELGKAGHDAATSSTETGVEHIFVKPLDSGLETTAVITTNRRVYHLRLISHSKQHTPYVGFLYPEDQFRQNSPLASRRDARPLSGSGIKSGSSQDLSALSFAYAIKGDAKWRPEQVYDDGKQTFLRLPPKVSSMPILLAKDASAQDLLVNYRVQGNTFVVDGVFEHLVLLSGTGRNQEKVDVRRKG